MRPNPPVKEARLRAADMIGAFARGEIDSDQFQDGYPLGCKDRGVKAVWWQVWGLYSDYFGPARFSPDRPPNAEVQALLGRCELFLRTDLPYEWPALGFWGTFRLLRWIPLVGRVARARRACFEAAGDTSAWPFLRREQLEQARLGSPHDPSDEVGR